ncbi:MAG: hypothetical protein JXA73_26530 [Acidobacteria bacterium]|nr:hypothetical protein [Acidobacteriota bacterium]
MSNSTALKRMPAGDLILDEPEPDSFFGPARSALQEADLLVGHVEVPHTRRRRELFGFEPDPNYPTYPFHPEARNAMIAVCEIGAEGVRKAGSIPCWVNPKGQPEICGDDARGRTVASCIRPITSKAALCADFEWDGNWARFL